MDGRQPARGAEAPATARWPGPHHPGLLIGETAALLGMTVKAIRVYHQRGVLPEPPRDHSGYRRYGASSLVVLARISRLRAVGLALREIRPLLHAQDGGEALRQKLRELDAALAARIADDERRRTVLGQLLEEGVDDPIAVSAAAVWEERSIATLRSMVPELTPEQEWVERRFVRALALLAGTEDERGDAVEEEVLGVLARELSGDFAAAHRRFHALADADPEDPRVAQLADDIRRTLRALFERLDAQVPPGGLPADGAHAEHVMTGLAAALAVLAPAQRRVMELVLPELFDEQAHKA